MAENTQESAVIAPENLISRSEELDRFASLLPLEEFGMYATRIINLWGEKQVGKSTFLMALRESSFMERKKIVWISPKYETSIDNPQEFISACSQEVRFPNNPQRGVSLAQRLEDSQKGKVDPIRSDDSLLITRSSIATKKQPYVHAAAAASVGRTSFLKEEMDISVGFGNNRAGNQAEAFLDALPLQSMGADLIVLHLSDPTTVSGSVREWFRNYVVPAATKGPYRRNLVVIVESSEPFYLQDPEESWGEWDEFVVDFELHPASIESVISFAHRENLSQEDSRFVFVRSLGYPATAVQAIDRLKSDYRDVSYRDTAEAIISRLTEDEKAKLAICSLPDTIHTEEFDAIVGPANSRETIHWLTSISDIPLRVMEEGKSYSLPDEFRLKAISSISESSEFRFAESRWLPYARLLRNAPNLSDRSKLYYVAGLKWIDGDRYKDLFEERAEDVSNFIEGNDNLFAKRKKYVHISKRIQSDLLATAKNLKHRGVEVIKPRVEFIWRQRQESLGERIEDLEKSLKLVRERLQDLQKSYSQVSILLKRFQANGTPVPSTPAKGLEKGKNGIYMSLLISFSCIAAIYGTSQEPPLNVVGFLGAFASIVVSLFLIPGWQLQRAAKESVKRSKVKNSPEYLRKENADLIQQIQENESAYDELRREITIAKEELNFEYV